MSKEKAKQARKEDAEKAAAAAPPPAYFLSVSLENVRCFGPRQTLDLSDGQGRPAPWTVILGDNGTGKTTLLQAIAALEPMNVGSFKDGKLKFYPRWITTPDLGLYRSNPDLVRFHLLSSIYCGSKLAERAQSRIIDNWEVEDGPTGVRPRPLSFEDIGGLICYAYGASRRMAETGLQEDENGDPTATLFSDDVALPSAEEWLLQADYAARRAKGAEKKKAEKRRDRVIALLIDLLPDVEAIRFAEPKEPRLVPRVEFQTPYGWVTIDQLGLGYRTMTAWTVDVARRLFERYPDSPNPLEEPAVVLVDEIDLHLHPKWQREIIRFLSERFPNTQFIVTAHSPLVVQAAADANIALLRREGDHVVIENDVEAIRNWRVDQILTSDLFGLESARPPHLDELLEKRRTLLSKGTLTQADRKRLADVEARIGALPGGETSEEIEAMDIIRRAATRLKQES